jgi:hypothetical protein
MISTTPQKSSEYFRGSTTQLIQRAPIISVTVYLTFLKCKFFISCQMIVEILNYGISEVLKLKINKWNGSRQTLPLGVLWLTVSGRCHFRTNQCQYRGQVVLFIRHRRMIWITFSVWHPPHSQRRTSWHKHIWTILPSGKQNHPPLAETLATRRTSLWKWGRKGLDPWRRMVLKGHMKFSLGRELCQPQHHKRPEHSIFVIPEK